MGLKHITPTKVLDCIADDIAFDMGVTKSQARELLADVLASEDIWNIIIARVKDETSKGNR